MSYYLVAPTGHSVELPPRPIVVGVQPDADLKIVEGLGVAPRHFAVLPDGEGHQIQLLAPREVLAINGMPISQGRLQHGDVIEAGQLRLEYKVPRLAAATPPPVPESYVASPAPHTGYAPPPPKGLAAYPDDDPNHVTYSSNPALRNVERAIAHTEYGRSQHERLKEEEKFIQAVLVGLVCSAIGVLAWAFASAMPWRIFYPAVAGIGYGLGWMVRTAGKGVTTRFAYLGAGLALLTGLATNYLGLAAAEVAMDAALDTSTVNLEEAMADFDEYAELNDDLSAEELAQMRVEHAKMIKALKESPAEVNFTTETYLWMIFNPRALLSYVFASVAAFRAGANLKN